MPKRHVLRSLSVLYWVAQTWLATSQKMDEALENVRNESRKDSCLLLPHQCGELSLDRGESRPSKARGQQPTDGPVWHGFHVHFHA